MKVKLNEIKAATPRVRKELNLDKLDELSDSIKETGGVIVPVKLRKNGTEKYTTVYGHRRIEACKLAGLTEIEAFVQDVDDDELLTQALIENVVREDMAALDIAKALKQIKLENDWTNKQVAAKFGMTDANVAMYLRMLKPEFKEVAELNPDYVSVQHITEAKAGTDDDADAVKVLEKAAKEGLSKRQTRTVAEEYTRAKVFGGQRQAQVVLKTPYEQLNIQQPFKPTPRAKLVVEPKGKVKKSWVTNPNIVNLDRDLQNVGGAIDSIEVILRYMKLNKRDRSVGTAGELKQVVKATRRALIAQGEKLITLANEMEVLSKEVDNV